MSFNIPLTSEKDFSDNITNTIFALGGIANRKPLGAHNQIVEVNSWSTVQSIVKLGLANRFFQVGDQLQSYHGTYGTGEQHLLTWDIIGIDHDIPCTANGTQLNTIDASGNTIPAHSMTLQVHSCISTRLWYHSNVNNWKDSDLRAWLNTDGIITDYSQDAGFLYNFDPDLLDVIGYVAKTTTRNNSSGGKALLLPERIFLLSECEVFAGFENGYAEGALILTTDTEQEVDKFYCTLDSTTGIITKVNTPVGQTDPVYEVKQWYEYYGAPNSDLPSPSTAADTRRIKQLGTSNQTWWLRSPTTGDTGNVRSVRSSGGIINYGAAYSHGVAPACVIC